MPIPLLLQQSPRIPYPASLFRLTYPHLSLIPSPENSHLIYCIALDPDYDGVLYIDVLRFLCTDLRELKVLVIRFWDFGLV